MKIALFESRNYRHCVNISHECQKGWMRFLLLIVISATAYSATENRMSAINWYMNHE